MAVAPPGPAVPFVPLAIVGFQYQYQTRISKLLSSRGQEWGVGRLNLGERARNVS